ncbi:MAG: hypothetical protein MUF79_07585 [Burkholderiales bacterium]|jgi:hypothetical protein|nr:hypothetical protein [Burkholderiales bacterium]
MKALSAVRALVIGVVLAAMPFAASAQQRLADGNDWAKSSADEKRAYLIGIGNAVTVAYNYDARKLPAEQVTFSRRARAGLEGVSVEETMRRVDAWYASNPSKLDYAVIAVMWLDIAKPKLTRK